MEENTPLIIAFLILVGGFIINIIPLQILDLFNTFYGRFIFLTLPLFISRIYGIEAAVLTGAIVGLIINRSHDFLHIQKLPPFITLLGDKKIIAPPQIYNGEVSVIRDMSPNLLEQSQSSTLILLDPPVKRLEQKYNIL